MNSGNMFDKVVFRHLKGDSDKQAHKHIDWMYSQTDATVEDRIEFARVITERFYGTYNKYPASGVLERLGSLILRDDYEDKNPHKVKTTEYPFLSAEQENRRKTGAHQRKFRDDGTYVPRGEFSIGGISDKLDTSGNIVGNHGRRELSVNDQLYKEGYRDD